MAGSYVGAIRGVPAAKDAIVAAGKQLGRWAENLAGGPARFQVIFVLSSVLGLDAADKATISAVAGGLEKAFHIGNTQLGLLVAVVSFAGAIGTLPFGVLIDRIVRRRILLAVILIWSAAEAITGLATSFTFMIAVRLVLGGVTAAAFPAVASLTGDYFPARDRARIYGLILAGS